MERSGEPSHPVFVEQKRIEPEIATPTAKLGAQSPTERVAPREVRGLLADVIERLNSTAN